MTRLKVLCNFFSLVSSVKKHVNQFFVKISVYGNEICISKKNCGLLFFLSNSPSKMLHLKKHFAVESQKQLEVALKCQLFKLGFSYVMLSSPWHYVALKKVQFEEVIRFVCFFLTEFLTVFSFANFLFCYFKKNLYTNFYWFN